MPLSSIIKRWIAAVGDTELEVWTIGRVRVFGLDSTTWNQLETYLDDEPEDDGRRHLIALSNGRSEY